MTESRIAAADLHPDTSFLFRADRQATTALQRASAATEVLSAELVSLPLFMQ